MTIHSSAQRLRIRTDWFHPHASAVQRVRSNVWVRLAALPRRHALHAVILGTSAAAALAAVLA